MSKNPVILVLYISYSALVACVEAGSNISAVALRVVEGDEKRTQCLGV
jgi:hypothetical protein